MAGKDFTTDAADVFVTKFTDAKPQAQKPQEHKQAPTMKAAQESAKQERICTMIDSGTMEKIRAIAYMDRLKIVDVMRAAVADYIDIYEKTHGKIKTR